MKTQKTYQEKHANFSNQSAIRCKLGIQRRILQLCDTLNISINKLGAICGISQSTLNNIISGRNNSTNVSTILKICDGLGITLQDFFDSDFFCNVEQEIV